MPLARSDRRGAVLFVIVAGAAFATSGPMARAARPMHPIAVAFARCAIAALILGLFEARTIGSALRALTARERWIVAGVGALLAAHFGLFLCGLDRTSLPAAVSLVSLEPLAVLLCAWAIHGLRPTLLEQVGVLVATAGAFLVARSAGLGEHSLLGDLFVVAAVALYGFYVAAARGLSRLLPPRSYAASVYAAAAISLLPFAIFSHESGSLGAGSLLACLGLAIVPTVIGHTAVQTAARRLAPSIVALVSPAETLGGVAIGAALMGATPTSAEFAGAIVILLGAGLAMLGARRAD
jgi:drug/metabolite transporter (DMT)-like permease